MSADYADKNKMFFFYRTYEEYGGKAGHYLIVDLDQESDFRPGFNLKSLFPDDCLRFAAFKLEFLGSGNSLLGPEDVFVGSK